MNKSIWEEYTAKPYFKSLKENISCDILVIGGGIAGLLTAHYLQQSGRQVVLAEAKKICGGITARTTAVISAQHDTPYRELINLHGKAAAKAYLDANLEAVEEYKRLAESIDCDFEIKPSYLYSVTDSLKSEYDALRSLDYEAELNDIIALPLEVAGAIKFDGMAEFHPLKFAYAIAKNLNICENTRIETLEDNLAITSENFRIKFKQAVVATHFPFINRTGLFFAKMHQNRSYVIALENAPDAQGTYIDDVATGYYWRNYKNYLLIGKGDHRTGTVTHAWEELEDFARKHYPEYAIAYKWANQDCVTIDSMPYIGRYGSFDSVYTLTGFNMWGMTGSMVGAKILTDKLNGKDNPYAFAFETDRHILRKEFFKNLGVSVVNMLRPTGKRCPHLGCALTYNKKEHSWDCACHGSRFTKDGKLIDNPSNKNANI